MANLVYSRDVRLIEIRETIIIIHRINKEEKCIISVEAEKALDKK